MASGYSDAAFRLLTQQATLRTLQQNNIKRCQVITFGQTPWTGFQKIRKNVEIVEISDRTIENYRLCDRYFKHRAVEWEGRLDVTRAISTIPYDGKVTFSSKSGRKDRTSIYGTEFHGTRYQFGFGITPESSKDRSRVLNLLDAIVSIYRVGGNHGRFLFDFAPESIILRWTNDFAPRFLYCYEEDEMGDISISKFLRQIKSGDLDPGEFWIGGQITEALQDSEYESINKFDGVKAAVNDLKQRITLDLNI